MTDPVSTISASTWTAIAVGAMTLFIALNGVLFDIKKDPDGKTGIRNLSLIGKILMTAMVFTGLYTIYKQITDDKVSSDKHQVIVDAQEQTKKELEETRRENKKAQATNQEKSQLIEDLTRNNGDTLKAIADISAELIDSQATSTRLMRDMQVKQQALETQLTKLADCQVCRNPELPILIDRPDDTDEDPVEQTPKFAKVTFEKIHAIENCEATNGNAGEFYYAFYANGQKLENPPFNLKNTLKINDGEKGPGAGNLGVISKIPLISKDDTIVLNGYIRERDPKNIWRNWTYKYNGAFSISLDAKKQSMKSFKVIDEKDCNVNLIVSIDVY